MLSGVRSPGESPEDISKYFGISFFVLKFNFKIKLEMLKLISIENYFKAEYKKVRNIDLDHVY